MQEKVSIIIPMFNSGQFVLDMIDSIINQTYLNWELIIVDDISNDGTFESVKSYVANEDKIQLIQRSKQPKGAQSCRNIGFEQSSGKYIIFFDADDLIYEKCLEQRVRFMECNPNLDFAIFPAHTISCSEDIGGFGPKRIYAKQPTTDDLGSLIKGEVPFAVWTNIYLRKSILDIKWDENIKIFQDLYFNFLAITEKLRFDYCEGAEFDYFYRINSSDGAITANFIQSEKTVSTIYLLNSILDKLKTRKDYPSRKKQLFVFCLVYFERLLFGGKTEDLKSYMSFVKQHYASKSRFLYIVLFFIQHINNIKVQKLIFSSLMIVFFQSKSHFSRIIKLFKIW